MALETFQIGCQPEKKAEYMDFLGALAGSTNAERLEEVFRLARKGALSEKDSEVCAETAILRSHMEKALKIYDGMAEKIAGMDKVVRDTVAERTAAIQAELDGQKAKIVEAEEFLAQRADMESRIAEFARRLAAAENRAELLKEKADQNERDKERLKKLEDTAAEQAAALETARREIAVMTKDAENKAEMIARQDARLAERDQTVQRERDQAAAALQHERDQSRNALREQEERLRQEIAALAADHEKMLQQERDQSRNALREQEERLRQESTGQLEAMKQANDALTQTLRAQIVEQAKIIAMIGKKDEADKTGRPKAEPKK